MEVSVLKFGGRSVDTPFKMELARKAMQRTSGRKVVVLSALSGVTNQLVEMALHWKNRQLPEVLQLIANINERHKAFARKLLIKKEHKDQCLKEVEIVLQELKTMVYASYSPESERAMVGFGELLSGKLFFHYLLESGDAPVHFSAAEYILLNEEGEPDWKAITRGFNDLFRDEFCNVFITEGFLCKNAEGSVDNLGRGGSDFTASIIGAATECKEVQIWTDIDGIHNNDPRFVKDTLPLSKLTYLQAANLSLAGSKVLHPKSIMPLEATSTPVRVISTTNRQTNGTVIGNEPDEDLLACAVRDVVFLKISNLIPGQLADILKLVERESDVKLGELLELRAGGSWLEFMICKTKKSLIQSLSDCYDLDTQYDLSVVSILGERLISEQCVLSMLPEVLSGFDYEVLYTSALQDRVLVKVREKDKEFILQLLHKELILKEREKVFQG